jgi:Brp/Blh family beta-carotene 15,15'-monooxygenase
MNSSHTPLLIRLKTIDHFLFPLAALISLVMIYLVPDMLSLTTQLALLGIVIVILGLPHGALDPWIAENIGIQNTRKQILLFNLSYLAIAVMVICVWYWLPMLSLLLFLAISAWHFSGDWKNDIQQPFRFCAGALLLLMPIGFHTETVSTIFEQLSGERGGNLAYALVLPAWLLTCAVALLAGWAFFQQQWKTALEFMTLLTLAYLTTPLVYFTLYFCLLHSPRHLLSLFSVAPPNQHPRLLKMMIVYTLATVLLVGILWWLWSALSTDTLILRLTFISLAAVTVPHMILIATAYLVKNRSAHSA